MTKKRLGRVILISTAAVLLLLVVASVSFTASYQNRILPHTHIGSVAVGGLNRADAIARVDEAIKSYGGAVARIDAQPDVTFAAADYGQYQVETTVDRVLNVGKTGGYLSRLGHTLRAIVFTNHQTLDYTAGIGQLTKAVREKLIQPYTDPAKEVTLKIASDGNITAVPGEAGQTVEVAAVKEAVLHHLTLLNAEPSIFTKKTFQPLFTVDDATAAINQAKAMITSPLELAFPDGKIVLATDKLSLLVTTATTDESTPKLVAVPDEVAISDLIKSLAEGSINRLPADAKLRFADGQLTVLNASQVGRTVDVAQSAKAVAAVLQQRANGQSVNTTELVVAQVAPSIDSTKITDLGIKEVIGRAATNYSTSSANRKSNIATGAAKITGSIIMPGQEFSTVKALGEVDAAAGYLPELVINQGKLEKEYGGGLCQPITTLFRAVLDAGLPVTDRTNHSRRVAYYEKASSVKGVRINWDGQFANSGSGLVGYDATVYIPNPDLKFKNDTAHAVLIQAFVTNNNQVTFELYGTNDGRTVSVSKASITDIPSSGGPTFTPDPTKPSNTMEAVEKPVIGAKTSFDYTITYADQTTKKQTFASYYKPVAGSYLVGTAEAAPATPTESIPVATQ